MFFFCLRNCFSGINFLFFIVFLIISFSDSGWLYCFVLKVFISFLFVFNMSREGLLDDVGGGVSLDFVILVRVCCQVKRLVVQLLGFRVCWVVKEEQRVGRWVFWYILLVDEDNLGYKICEIYLWKEGLFCIR